MTEPMLGLHQGVAQCPTEMISYLFTWQAEQQGGHIIYGPIQDTSESERGHYH